MNKKFGWCFIGASRIAYKCAKEILSGKNGYITSIYNRTYDKALDFAKSFNAKAYENVIDAINDPNVDGVYISLTNDMHFEYMKLCIKNHKHILCEKPFTMNEKEAIEIFDLAKEYNVYVAEAMWTWFNEPAYKIKEWIKEVGNIKSVECYFGFEGRNVPRLMNINLLGGGLLDIGVYGLRYSLELFGCPNNIECSGKLSDSGIDLHETIIFHYETFDVKHYFAIDEDLHETYLIKGDKGVIDAVDFHMTNVVKFKNETFKTKYHLYERQFALVANEIRSGLLSSKYVTKENTIKCMRLMDECRKQLGVIYPKENIQ